MTESVYKIIELVGTSTESGKRPPRQPSSEPASLLGISASRRSPNSICKSTEAKSKPTAPR